MEKQQKRITKKTLGCVFFLLALFLFGVTRTYAADTAPTETADTAPTETADTAPTEAAGARNGLLCIRPSFESEWHGTLELTVKHKETGEVLTCRVDPYRYAYEEYSGLFYWSEMQAPVGTYEILRLTAQDLQGHYFLPVVKETEIPVYEGWSGMVYFTVTDMEIPEDAAGRIYTEETDLSMLFTPEPKAQPKQEKKENRDYSKVFLIILSVVIFLPIFLTGLYFLYRAEKMRKEEAAGEVLKETDSGGGPVDE